jgi:hypothetical protein
VVCFDADGGFLGEFGGKGISPGWFYHPTLLAVDDSDLVYIGQVYRNKIQVCKIPDFIINGARSQSQGILPAQNTEQVEIMPLILSACDGRKEVSSKE